MVDEMRVPFLPVLCYYPPQPCASNEEAKRFKPVISTLTTYESKFKMNELPCHFD